MSRTKLSKDILRTTIHEPSVATHHLANNKFECKQNGATVYPSQTGQMAHDLKVK